MARRATAKLVIVACQAMSTLHAALRDSQKHFEIAGGGVEAILVHIDLSITIVDRCQDLLKLLSIVVRFRVSWRYAMWTCVARSTLVIWHVGQQGHILLVWS